MEKTENGTAEHKNEKNRNSNLAARHRRPPFPRAAEGQKGGDLARARADAGLWRAHPPRRAAAAPAAGQHGRAPPLPGRAVYGDLGRVRDGPYGRRPRQRPYALWAGGADRAHPGRGPGVHDAEHADPDPSAPAHHAQRAPGHLQQPEPGGAAGHGRPDRAHRGAGPCHRGHRRGAAHDAHDPRARRGARGLALGLPLDFGVLQRGIRPGGRIFLL